MDVTEQELRALANDIIDGLFRVGVPLRGLPYMVDITLRWEGTSITHTITGINTSADESDQQAKE